MPVFVIAPLSLQPADAERVALLRKSYDPNAAVVPPHVTLVYGVDDGLESEALRWARIHAGAFAAVSLRFTLATVARDYENSAWYLFLMPKQIPPILIELHRRLNAGPLQGAPDVAFDAHLTLGRFQERVLADAVARDCNAAGVAIETRIAALEVVLFDGKEARNRTTLPLGAA
ncbi:2'-5' RNA ligase family protein [Dongia sp.]|uniref:2'-5' RNA ligase family protein n=1 Tax=Dongia sp. TaxID=1977262 RepID=UPI003750D7B3